MTPSSAPSGMTFLLVQHRRFLEWLRPARPLLYAAEREGRLKVIDASRLSAERLARTVERQGKGRYRREWHILAVADEAEALLTPVLTYLQDPPETFTLLAIGGSEDRDYGFSPIRSRFSAGFSTLPAHVLWSVVRMPDLLEDTPTARLKAVYLLLALLERPTLSKGEFYALSRDISLDEAQIGTLLRAYEAQLEQAHKEVKALELRFPLRLYERRVKDDILLPSFTLPASAPELLAPDPPRLPGGWLFTHDYILWLRWRERVETRLGKSYLRMQHEATGYLTRGLERLSQLERALTPQHLEAEELERRILESEQRRKLLQGSVYQPESSREGQEGDWDGLETRFRHALFSRPPLWGVILSLVIALIATVPTGLLQVSRDTSLLSIGGLMLLTLLLLLLVRERIYRPVARSRLEAQTLAADALERLKAQSETLFSHMTEQLELWVVEGNLESLRTARDEARELRLARRYHLATLEEHLQGVWRLLEGGAADVGVQPVLTPAEVDIRRDVLANPAYHPPVLPLAPADAPALFLAAARVPLSENLSGLKRIGLEPTLPPAPEMPDDA